jgi:hypothetical protein
MVLVDVDCQPARVAARQWAEARGILEDPEDWARFACDADTFEAIAAHRRPVLHLEDVSAIPFVSVIPGVEQYQHRARVRAFTGDIFAAVTPISPGYEPYCRDVLDLGTPGTIIAEPVDQPTAVARACRRGDAWHQIVAWANESGHVAIHPYMAIEDVWELAAALERETASVVVLGPTPGALWVANDKSLMSEVVELVAGEGWTVRTERATDPETLARELQSIATHSRYVGLKRTRCASAMGNIVYESQHVLDLDPAELREEVKRFLGHTEWDGREEVLAVEWADTDISPSTQMWIPPLGAGDPILEGIYEQLLEGPEKIFLGSRPSTLPEAVHRGLAESSLLVSAAFQAMGYVGRCSFDFIVVGDPQGEFGIRFTECNGRWGGTSTPMFLVDRLGWRDPESGRRRPYHAQDYVHPDLVGAQFEDVLGATRDHLFDPRTGEGRFILYNVGPLEGTGKFDVISLGRTNEEAIEGVGDLLPRLLGLH